MASLSLKKLINSRAAFRPINDESKHLWKVLERKQEIMKMRLDIENGFIAGEEIEVPDTQLFLADYKGTHPRQSLWSKIKNVLRELLP